MAQPFDKDACYFTVRDCLQDDAAIDGLKPFLHEGDQRRLKPSDMAVDHVCGNRHCLNFRHWRLVPIKENRREK